MYDSQETISEEKTESDFIKTMGYIDTIQYTPLLQQKEKSVKSEFQGKGK